MIFIVGYSPSILNYGLIQENETTYGLCILLLAHFRTHFNLSIQSMRLFSFNIAGELRWINIQNYELFSMQFSSHLFFFSFFFFLANKQPSEPCP